MIDRRRASWPPLQRVRPPSASEASRRACWRFCACRCRPHNSRVRQGPKGTTRGRRDARVLIFLSRMGFVKARDAAGALGHGRQARHGRCARKRQALSSPSLFACPPPPPFPQQPGATTGGWVVVGHVGWGAADGHGSTSAEGRGGRRHRRQGRIAEGALLTLLLHERLDAPAPRHRHLADFFVSSVNDCTCPCFLLLLQQEVARFTSGPRGSILAESQV